MRRRKRDVLRFDRDAGIMYVTHLIRDGYMPGCPTCDLAARWASTVRREGTDTDG